MTKYKSVSPLTAAARTDDVAHSEATVPTVAPYARELRKQQGLLQRTQTSLSNSRSAGDAERKLQRIAHEGQVRIAQNATEIFVDQTVKTLRMQSAAHNQMLNERLEAQEIQGVRSLSDIGAEGMVRLEEDHAARIDSVDARLARGAIRREQADDLAERFAGLRQLSNAACDRAITSSLEDTAAYFDQARKKLRQ